MNHAKTEVVADLVSDNFFSHQNRNVFLRRLSEDAVSAVFKKLCRAIYRLEDTNADYFIQDLTSHRKTDETLTHEEHARNELERIRQSFSYLLIAENIRNLSDRELVVDKIHEIPFTHHLTVNFTDRQSFDIDAAEKTVHSLMRAVSKRVFSRSYRRDKKLVPFTARIEHAPTTNRLHAHLLVQKPENRSENLFQNVLTDALLMNPVIPNATRASLIQNTDNDRALAAYQVKNDINLNDHEHTDAKHRFIWNA
jgi:hypothetical protein